MKFGMMRSVQEEDALQCGYPGLIYSDSILYCVVEKRLGHDLTCFLFWRMVILDDHALE